MAVATPYLINSTEIVLTAGDWQLSWGSIDAQQVTTSKISIGADTSGGNVSVQLPQSSAQQSTNAQFSLIKATADGNSLFINAGSGDTINGSSTQTITTQWKAAVMQLFLTNWIAVVTP